MRLKNTEHQRLNKFIASRGLASRREAEVWIENGWVLVNETKATEKGHKVEPGDEICILSEAIDSKKQQLSIVLHKPLGVLSHTSEDNYRTVFQLLTAENYWNPDNAQDKPLPHFKKLAPVGRLDIDSRGLLLLTEDGVLAKKVIGPKSQMEKEYVVTTTTSITDAQLKKLSFGLFLEGQPLKRALVERLKPDQFRITLTEGKNRQIRKMCNQLGLEAKSLLRIRIGPIKLGALPYGKWRQLSANEIKQLHGNNK